MLKEKVKKLAQSHVAKAIAKGGIKFAIFAISLEIFEHVVLPMIMIWIGKPYLAWIGATPLDELVIYPLVLRFFFKAAKIA